MTGLRWTHKTTEKIRRQLRSIGIRVSRSTIARLLKEQGFALRVNHKQIARVSHEHRDRQVQYIKRLRQSFAKGRPVHRQRGHQEEGTRRAVQEPGPRDNLRMCQRTTRMPPACLHLVLADD